MEAMQELMQGQNSLNQGMGSLLPIPLGGEPSEMQGLMESLMQQQKKIMEELNKLIEEGPPGGESQGGLGKALEDMNEIIRDFEQNNVSQESVDRGKRVYRKLLEHQRAMKSKGFDNNWKAEENNDDELLENNSILNLNDSKNIELKELYETLDGLQTNKNLTPENKSIIQEYLRILIKEKLTEDKNEK